MPSLLPTPEPADPVEGQPGHFEHSNWLKASVKALDSGVVHKSGDTMTGNFIAPNVEAKGVTGRLITHKPGVGVASFQMESGIEIAARVGGSTDVALGGLAQLKVEMPEQDFHAATKGYVDTTKVSKAGDTMSGNLAIPNGTAAGHAVNKGQLDAKVPGKIQRGSIVSNGTVQRVTFPEPYASGPVVITQTNEAAREAYAAVVGVTPSYFDVITVNPTSWTPISNVYVHWLAID